MELEYLGIINISYIEVYFIVKRKLIWALITLVLFVLLFEVVFRTRTVTYMGENKNWLISINAKLVGLNGSYNIEVRHKGKEPIHGVYFNIHPHYDVGFPILNDKGYYYWECKDNCEYYDKDSKLLFFVSWKEDKITEEKMEFIELRKISPNKKQHNKFIQQE